MADAPKYQSLPLASLPKRQPPAREGWDKDAAAALLAVISADPTGDPPSPPTATDGTAYADQKLARAEANKAKRLVGHVLPEGKAVKTAIFGLDKKGQPVAAAESAGTFGWALWLIDAPAETPAAETPAAK